MRKLRLFDFDDTLVKTKANVYVRNGGQTKALTPTEFAAYTPKSGDVFNFSEFDAVVKSASPIHSNVELLKQAASDPNTKTTILTARMLAYPVKRYLKKEHGLDVYVVAVGDSDPQKKADYIEKEIKKGYSDIIFIDDSIKNVQAVEALKHKYPEVSLQVIHTTDHEKVLESLQHDKTRLHSKGRKKNNSLLS